MAQVFLNAGDKLTLTSGAVMITGPYGGVIDAQVRNDGVREGFSFPANPKRAGQPYGYFEKRSRSEASSPLTLFDVYLDLDTNGLWYDDRHGFSPFEGIEADRVQKNPLIAALDRFSAKLCEWLAGESAGSATQPKTYKTLAEVIKQSEESTLKMIVADHIEANLVLKLLNHDSMLMNTVLSMLSTRVRAGDDSDVMARFETQLSQLDRHVDALTLYGMSGGEMTDVPFPRECIESLMVLPKLAGEIFSDSGFATTIFIPCNSPHHQIARTLDAFYERTGIKMEIVSAS